MVSKLNGFGIGVHVKSLLKSDISVLEGRVPENLEKIIFSNERFKMSESEIIYDLEGTAKYHLIEGKKIIVEPYGDKDFERINLYLNSLIWGLVLLQRNLLVLHGSAIVHRNKCIVFMGDCGAGKSTMCSALINRGYKYLSDDISIISFNNDGQPLVYPGMPEQRLCSDVAEELKYSEEILSLVCAEDNKYVITNTKDFITEKVKLAAIVELVPKSGAEVSLIKVAGTEKVSNLIRNIYCSTLLQKIGIDSEIFKQVVSLAKTIDIFKLERPIEGLSIDDQVEVIIELIELLGCD